jgi:hypothetical protein
MSIAAIGLELPVTVYRGFREIVRLSFVESTFAQRKQLPHDRLILDHQPRTFDRYPLTKRLLVSGQWMFVTPRVTRGRSLSKVFSVSKRIGLAPLKSS